MPPARRYPEPCGTFSLGAFGPSRLAVMKGRKCACALLAGLLLVVALARCGGSNAARSLPRTEGWGDPSVTDAQPAAMKVGMSDSEAFRLISGEGSSGDYSNGPGSVNSVRGRRR